MPRPKIKDGDDAKMTSGVRVLVIGGIEVKTNLTYADLANPKLWGLRSPEAWARAVAAGQFGWGEGTTARQRHWKGKTL